MQKRQVTLAGKNFENVCEGSFCEENHRKYHSEKTTFELSFPIGPTAD
jgi:hypothetical protein